MSHIQEKGWFFLIRICELRFQIVCFKVNAGLYETIFTNLDEDDTPILATSQ